MQPILMTAIALQQSLVNKRELSVDAMAEMEHLEVCYKLQDNVYLCLKNIRYIER